MPPRRSVWSSWNYARRRPTDPERRRVRHLLDEPPAGPPSDAGHVFVSLNPLREPAPELVHAEVDYAHPLFDAAAIAAQRRLGAHPGRGRPGSPAPGSAPASTRTACAPASRWPSAGRACRPGRRRPSPRRRAGCPCRSRRSRHDAGRCASCLYAGRVMHQRLRPVRHRFAYRIFSLLLDLDELDEARPAAAPVLGRPLNLLSFQPADHGAARRLAAASRGSLAELARGRDRAGGAADRAALLPARARLRLQPAERLVLPRRASAWRRSSTRSRTPSASGTATSCRWTGRHRVAPAQLRQGVLRLAVHRRWTRPTTSRRARRASGWRSSITGARTRAGRCSSPATRATPAADRRDHCGRRLPGPAGDAARSLPASMARRSAVAQGRARGSGRAPAPSGPRLSGRGGTCRERWRRGPAPARPCPARAWPMRAGMAAAGCRCGRLEIVLPDHSRRVFAGPKPGPRGGARAAQRQGGAPLPDRRRGRRRRGLHGGRLGQPGPPCPARAAGPRQRGARRGRPPLGAATLARARAPRVPAQHAHAAAGATSTPTTTSATPSTRRWLDPTMTYSSALFAARRRRLRGGAGGKYRRLAEQHRAGSRATACWRSAAAGAASRLTAAKEFGAGHRHHDLARSSTTSRASASRTRGLAEQVEIRLQDYRDVEGRFDRIASIEMFEAVGERYWPTYLRAPARAPEPGRPGRRCRSSPSPTTSSTPTAAAPTSSRPTSSRAACCPRPRCCGGGGDAPGWRSSDDRTFGPDYARTLAEWRRRFDAAWQQLAPLGFDERFRRLWKYYLAYCEAGFRSGAIDVTQVSLRLA